MSAHFQRPPSIALCLELLTDLPPTPLPGGRLARLDPYLGRLVEVPPAACEPRQRLNFSPEQRATVDQIALAGRMARHSVYQLIRSRMGQNNEQPDQALQAIADQFRTS